jgi:hypothetical protein
MQEFAKIVLFAVGAAVSYGVMHDQITARICVEYFTVGHPPVFATTSPTLLGLGWGVIATWWVGIALGVPLALSARLGREPKLSAAFFLRPLGRLLVVTTLCAAVAGVAGYWCAQTGLIHLPIWVELRLPAERHTPFLVDSCAHLASYALGSLGGLGLISWTVRLRRKTSRAAELSAATR